jgi:hypothetical protein
MAIFISALMFSQKPIIQKIKINGENGFKANEVVMDSIMEVHYKMVSLVSDSTSLSLKLNKLQLKYDKTLFDLNFYKKDNERLELEKIKFSDQLLIKDKINENDLLYYKNKAKQKWEYFLYGTAVGAIVIALLVLL